ncbi:hypothetical protein [Paenibacillus sp. MMO-177]|uniref:hypothetical protein n=1 Tax=Paenibacillus sp. MMO-177 TaxID=3081289 RepID=UPI003018D9D5
MIKKIVSIKNTGKFKACTPKGDIQFNKLSILYSENGRGKTTLSNIFRSLSEQDPQLVIGRKTLGSNGGQSIDILTDKGLIKYKDNQWSNKTDFEFEIFDSLFVSQNVYSRHIVEHDQKKNCISLQLENKG